MALPIKICSVCGDEFELRPDKPGFANRCPACSVEGADGSAEKSPAGNQAKADAELNAARRLAMRNLLYRKDS